MRENRYYYNIVTVSFVGSRSYEMESTSKVHFIFLLRK